MAAVSNHSLVGVVVSAGRMMKAVKVRTTKQRYQTYIRKHYRIHPLYMVSDPADSLRAGDIIRFSPWITSKHINHVVTEIIAAYGPPIEHRPPVPTEEERLEKKRLKREAKLERRKHHRSNGNVSEGEDGAAPKVDTTGELDTTAKPRSGIKEDSERIFEAGPDEKGVSAEDLDKRLKGLHV